MKTVLHINKNMLPIYIDIDGTLTDKDIKGGNPIQKRIDGVKKLIANGKDVVIWSANGTRYAKWFCQKHDIHPLAILGKPAFCIDDNPRIRPKLRIIKPNWLENELRKTN